MARFAIVENGVVVNVVLADAGPVDSVDVSAVPGVGPGWTYDGEEFTAPVVPDPPPVVVSSVTPQRMLREMTVTEKAGILTASNTDPVVTVFVFLLQNATLIDVDNQDLVDGLNYLESQALLAAGRASEILTGIQTP